MAPAVDAQLPFSAKLQGLRALSCSSRLHAEDLLDVALSDENVLLPEQLHCLPHHDPAVIDHVIWHLHAAMIEQ